MSGIAMRKFAVGALLLIAAVPSNAGTLTSKQRVIAANTFGKLADVCAASFGFTRLPKRSDAVLADKMEAYLLLAPSSDYVLSQWNDILKDGLAMERARTDDVLANRLADAIVAAQKDPDSYDRAEALYVETFKVPVETVVRACRSATQDAFLGANYVTGDGSADRYDEVLKAEFLMSVRPAK